MLCIMIVKPQSGSMTKELLFLIIFIIRGKSDAGRNNVCPSVIHAISDQLQKGAVYISRLKVSIE